MSGFAKQDTQYSHLDLASQKPRNLVRINDVGFGEYWPTRLELENGLFYFCPPAGNVSTLHLPTSLEMAEDAVSGFDHLLGHALNFVVVNAGQGSVQLMVPCGEYMHYSVNPAPLHSGESREYLLRVEWLDEDNCCCCALKTRGCGGDSCVPRACLNLYQSNASASAAVAPSVHLEEHCLEELKNVSSNGVQVGDLLCVASVDDEGKPQWRNESIASKNLGTVQLVQAGTGLESTPTGGIVQQGKLSLPKQCSLVAKIGGPTGVIDCHQKLVVSDRGVITDVLPCDNSLARLDDVSDDLEPVNGDILCYDTTASEWTTCAAPPFERVETTVDGQSCWVTRQNTSKLTDAILSDAFLFSTHNTEEDGVFMMYDVKRSAFRVGQTSGQWTFDKRGTFSTGFGFQNTASGFASAVLGGANNEATNNYALVCQGQQNKASKTYASVYQGEQNTASGNYALVCQGQQNVASGACAFVGCGLQHQLAGDYSFVGNGIEHVLNDPYTLVVNGTNNTVSQEYATVVNGRLNAASALQSVIVNGEENTNAQPRSFVGSGFQNKVEDSATSATYGFIGSGANNRVDGTSATIVNGQSNVAFQPRSFIGNGLGNKVGKDVLINFYGFIGNGSNNIAEEFCSTVLNGGSNKCFARYSTIGNGLSCVIENACHHSVIGGGYINKCLNGISSSYNGIFSGYQNETKEAYSCVLGGLSNKAYGGRSCVVGGNNNEANALWSIIGGGGFNKVNAWYGGVFSGNFNKIDSTLATYAFIGGGYQNKVLHTCCAVVGGDNNLVTRECATALGGKQNNVRMKQSTVLSGTLNQVGTSDDLSQQTDSAIVTGEDNCVNGSRSVIVCGQSNDVGPNNSAVLCGTRNNVRNNSTNGEVVVVNSSILAGSGLNAYLANTAYTQNFKSVGAVYHNNSPVAKNESNIINVYSGQHFVRVVSSDATPITVKLPSLTLDEEGYELYIKVDPAEGSVTLEAIEGSNNLSAKIYTIAANPSTTYELTSGSGQKARIHLIASIGDNNEWRWDEY